MPSSRDGVSETEPGRVSRRVPREVARLLESPQGPGRDAAWQDLVDHHSRLILSTVRSVSSDYDAAMDQYAFVLEGLSRDDYQRLRTFARADAGRFEAWLVVVTRRLCIDYQRSRYGRVKRKDRREDPDDEHRARERRRLLDLVTEELDIARTADRTSVDPEADVRRRELEVALQEALGSLAARDRLLLRFRFEDGRSAREIADAMGFPSPFHVYRRLKKVLEELRLRLRERGVSDSLP